LPVGSVQCGRGDAKGPQEATPVQSITSTRHDSHAATYTCSVQAVFTCTMSLVSGLVMVRKMSPLPTDTLSWTLKRDIRKLVT